MQASIVGYCSCLVIIDVWMIAQLLKAQLVYLQFLYVVAVNINEVKGFFWKILYVQQLFFIKEATKLFAVAHNPSGEVAAYTRYCL